MIIDTLRNCSLLLVCAALAGCAELLPPAQPQPDHSGDAAERQVKEQLQSPTPTVPSDEQLMAEALGFAEGICLSGPPGSAERHWQELRRRGEILRPAFEKILADPKSDSRKVSGTFPALITAQLGGHRFCELAAERLADRDDSVRRGAVSYLGRYGSVYEAPKVVPLLSDSDRSVRKSAVRTLAKIGGKRDLEALDAWLKDGNHPDDGDYLILVKKCRDELELRLTDNPVPKDLIN